MKNALKSAIVQNISEEKSPFEKMGTRTRFFEILQNIPEYKIHSPPSPSLKPESYKVSNPSDNILRLCLAYNC